MSKYVTVQITHKEPPGTPPPESDDGLGCPKCLSALTPAELEVSYHVCPHCDHHLPLSAPDRVAQLADPGSWREVGGDLRPEDPLHFFDVRPYTDRLEEAQLETGLSEAFLGGLCTLRGRPTALGVMDFRFLGGSMGSVVGERFVRLTERAIQEQVSLVVITSSGGARMQEGILSLMQMAKTVVALDLLAEQGLPFVSVLAHPTTGGVLASFATLADIIVAEPGALLLFTGQRVIEQTTREKLPADFGRANIVHGQVDMVVDRRRLKETLARLLALLEGGVRCSLEPLRQDTKVIPRGGNPLAQAVERAKELALPSRRRVHRRDPED